MMYPRTVYCCKFGKITSTERTKKEDIYYAFVFSFMVNRDTKEYATELTSGIILAAS